MQRSRLDRGHYRQPFHNPDIVKQNLLYVPSVKQIVLSSSRKAKQACVNIF